MIQKSKLAELYYSGKSMKEISDIFNCSVNKVVYWMDKYKLKRRSVSEAIYKKWNPNGDPFSIKQNLNQEETLLLGLGLGIYWGEGEKVSRYAVRVANTDPSILKMFIRFLLEVCQLEKRKLGYSIVCFNDSEVERVRRYWAGELMVSPDKFGKIVQIPPQGKGKYRRKSQYGVCTVSVGSIKLKKWILGELVKYRI